MDDVGISSVILSNWKQADLLLCDRGSLWCRRVIDPESQKKEAVYVLAARGDEIVTTVPEEEIVEDDLAMDVESDGAEKVDSNEEWQEDDEYEPEDPDDWDEDETLDSIGVDDDDDFYFEDEEMSDESDDNGLIDENDDGD